MDFHLFSRLKRLASLKHGFTANILTLMSGTLLSQLLVVVSTPILSRLYSPADFGNLSLFNSIITILSAQASWRFDQAIVLPEQEDDAFILMVISLVLVMITTLFLMAWAFFWGEHTLSLMQVPSMIGWLWWIPLSVFLVGVFQTFNYWCSRCKQFRLLAMAQISRSGITIGSQMGLGLWPNFAGAGLIWGNITGQIVAVGILGSRTTGKIRCMARSFHFRRCFTLITKFKNIARYSIVTDFLNIICLNLMPIILNYFYGLALVGAFMLSQKLVTLPSQLIIGSTWQTTYSDLGRLDFPKQRQRLCQIHRSIAFIFALPMLALCLFPGRVDELLGKSWQGVGAVTIPLALMAYVNAVSNSVSYFASFEFFGVQALVNIVLAIFRLGSLIIGGLFLSPLATIYLFSISSLLVYAAVNIGWGIYFSDTRKYIANICVSLIVSLIILIPIKLFINNASFGIFLVLLGILTILYYLGVFYFLLKEHKVALGRV